MLTFYLVALAIGGTLVGMTLAFGDGGDLEADLQLDTDLDTDVGTDLDHHVEVSAFDVIQGWLPVTSLRFWTFFLAFAGLTGTLLTALASMGAVFVGISAGAVGYVSGLGMTSVLRRLQREVIDSSVTARDYIGEAARVVLPIQAGKTGKVRLQLKGRTIDLLAESDDSAPLEVDSNVIVYGVEDDGRVIVSKVDELSS